MKLALDVGGTYTKYAYVEHNCVYERGQFDTIYTSADDFCEAVNQRLVPETQGIALAIGGYYRNGVYLGFGSIPYVKENKLMGALQKFSLPIAIENDCICAGLCESKIGSLVGVNNAVVVVLGSAMGSCLLLQGQLYQGSHNHASMLFQMPEQMDVVQGISRYDYYSNTFALNQEYTDYYKEKINFKIIEEKMQLGDPIAAGVVDRYCQAVANKIICTALVVDPEKVVIGGGVANSKNMIDTIKWKVKELYQEIKCSQDFLIEKCSFEDCNLLGAAMLPTV